VGDGAEGALAVQERLKRVGVGVLDQADDDDVIAAVTSCSVRQTSHWPLPASRGAPWSMYQATSANLSSPFLANAVAKSCWPTARTFTPNRPVSAMIFSRSERWSSETRIIGGSSESDENALTVVPCGLRSTCEVTTVTGVGTRASVSLKTVASTWSRPWLAPTPSIRSAYVHWRRSARALGLDAP
jgi:hypothetical protein